MVPEERRDVTQSQITPEIQRFIATHINAAEQLDILLLLHASPDRSFTAGDVSQAIFTVPTSATARLEELASSGFLTSTGGSNPEYRYAPKSSALAAQVDSLAGAYRANRVAVINLVFQRPPDPLKSFSDAFRLRREE